MMARGSRCRAATGKLLAAALAAAPIGATAADADPLDCAGAALRPQLLARAEADQQGRARLRTDSPARADIDAVLRSDAENTDFMRRVLARCGWPTRSAVGEDGAQAAWLLTQHADMDPAYQAAAAQRMKQAVLAGEADATRLALLTDRYRRLTDLPQVYGMQYVLSAERHIVFHDIVTPSQLDARRREIGLPSFTCWALQLSAQHGEAPIVWPQGALLQPAGCAPAR